MSTFVRILYFCIVKNYVHTYVCSYQKTILPSVEGLVYTYVHTYVCTYVCMYVGTRAEAVCMYMYVHTYVHTSSIRTYIFLASVASLCLPIYSRHEVGKNFLDHLLRTYVIIYLCRYFPKIFGPDEDQELNKKETMNQFDKLTEEVNAYLKEQDGPTHKPMTVPEVAMGFVQVANETMCRPIRALTQVHKYYIQSDTHHLVEDI